MTDLGGRIADAALGMEGTPWKGQGRLPKLGLDCVGLGFCAVQEAGGTIVDFLDYGAMPSIALLRGKLEEQLCPVTRDDMRVGDFLVFRVEYRRDLTIGHMGIYCGAGTFVHTKPTKPKAVHVTRLTPSWLRRIDSIFRVEE